MQENAGEIAGKSWNALNEKGEMTGKELKKATAVKTENLPETSSGTTNVL